MPEVPERSEAPLLLGKEEFAGPEVRHQARKHAKLSASGAERWTECPASVHLSEGRPDKDTIWSKEGTLAHELLESYLRASISGEDSETDLSQYPEDMQRHVIRVAAFIYNTHRGIEHSELLVEGESHLDFISPDMWGTYDGAIIDLFGTLHVFDFKYGAGHVVQVEKNLQTIFYALGLAHRFDWNFQRVRLWIIQPRVQGYDGPAFWELTIEELRRYVEFFRRAAKRVAEEPNTFKEGRHCFYCKARPICPLKLREKMKEGKRVFSTVDKEVLPTG